MQTPFISDICTALQNGNLQVAERLSRAYLANLPGDESVLTLLGMSLQFQGRSIEAVETYRELTQRLPDVKEHWNNLGTALRESKQLNEAEAAYRRAFELAPKDASVLVNFGFLYMERANYVIARDYLLRAHECDPDLIDARIYGATMCYECGDNPNAERLLAPWPTWTDISDELRLELGWALTQLGKVDVGAKILLRALDQAQQKSSVRVRLAMLFERINRLNDARTMLDGLPSPESITDQVLRHEVISAHASLASRENDPSKARALLEGLIQVPEPESSRSNLYFALARICDKQNDVEAVMNALRLAHESQMETAAQLVPELLEPDVQPLQTATHYVSAQQYQTWPTYISPGADASPVFIMGFPRSGTTMLEQMLDTHPALVSMDERAFLQSVTNHMKKVFGLSYPNDLALLSAEQCEQLRQVYWRLASQQVQLTPGLRLVDKNPLNMLRLPLIYRLFPNAQIIFALRHPCDVVLSCYMQNFRSPVFAVLCRTLDHLSRGYVNAMRFWLHHAKLLAPNVMELKYEELLADFPGNTQRIGEFLSLQDVSCMLKFNEHAKKKGFISTPSYAQVVEPLNSSAMNRWRRYARFLEPVVPILRPIMEHWSYDE